MNGGVQLAIGLTFDVTIPLSMMATNWHKHRTACSQVKGVTKVLFPRLSTALRFFSSIGPHSYQA